MLRTIAVARLLLRDMNIQAPPNLSDDHYERLLEAGIDDWGGVSPLTPDYINPEAPWPHLAGPAAPHRGRRTAASSAPAGVSRVRVRALSIAVDCWPDACWLPLTITATRGLRR